MFLSSPFSFLSLSLSPVYMKALVDNYYYYYFFCFLLHPSRFLLFYFLNNATKNKKTKTADRTVLAENRTEIGR